MVVVIIILWITGVFCAGILIHVTSFLSADIDTGEGPGSSLLVFSAFALPAAFIIADRECDLDASSYNPCKIFIKLK